MSLQPAAYRADMDLRQTPIVACSAGGKRHPRCRYRDGRWFNDEDAHDYEMNDYGERNCILDLT